jgi:fumarate hydratase class II
MRAELEQPLWGAETDKAIANFPISGEPVPIEVVHWIARIKSAAAVVNADLELLDADRAARIASSADRVAAGEFDSHFPIDVFQTGSGTSTHMNVNEVIASLAGAGVHPNDHVNVCQSSNCVFPSAVHLAALEAVTSGLLPALVHLREALELKSEEYGQVAKAGRTHLMDAVPVTLGQEFAGWASQIAHGEARVLGTLHRLSQVPLGGTATGTGLNVHPEFAPRVLEMLRSRFDVAVTSPDNFFEATGARDGLVEASGALRSVAVSLMKIASDVRLLGSGPRTGVGELVLPELQHGSSMMPGKVNPVIPEVVVQVAVQVIGNDAAIALAGSQGHLELNANVPVMARNLLQSIALLASASRVFADRCVHGLTADEQGCARSARSTLASITALNPYVGYELGARIVEQARASGDSLDEAAAMLGVDPVLRRALDPLTLAQGGLVGPERSTT